MARRESAEQQDANGRISSGAKGNLTAADPRDLAHSGCFGLELRHGEKATEAIRLEHQAVELTEQHEVTWWQAAACAILGDTVLLAGDRAGAIALFERGLAAARQAGVEGYLLRCADGQMYNNKRRRWYEGPAAPRRSDIRVESINSPT